MVFRKRVPDEFGIIVPRDNDTFWVKQGGGMSCLQRELEGLYIPIGKIKYNLGSPSWSPEGPNFVSKLRRIDLQSVVSEEEYQSFPDKVQRRGNFDGYTEYSNWIEDSEHYGWITLYDELFRFTYGIFENLDSDPRNRWADTDELWETICESLGFNFEFLSYSEYSEMDFDSYPKRESAIRPIRIIESKKNRRGNAQCEWADDLSGEVLFLLCPNAD